MSRLLPLPQPFKTPPCNALLAALAPLHYQGLVPHLQVVRLHPGTVLYESGALPDWVYFLNAGVVAQMLTSDAGQAVEMGLIGSEGLVGIEAILPNRPMLHQHSVQLAGNSWRMDSTTFRQQVRLGATQTGTLHDILLHYQHWVLAQTAQSALCLALHPVLKRLCTKLLLLHDQVDGDELTLTQEVIAAMMATQRAGVTHAIASLRAAGLIDTRRGSIIIINRQGLEQAACECYANLQHQKQVLLPQKQVLPQVTLATR